MKDLIKINYDTEQPTVSARELHEGLEIGTRFNDWFLRMVEYGFSEGKDFYSKMSKTSESTGGHPATDYDITVDMAKQICMIQRTDKGIFKLGQKVERTAQKSHMSPDGLAAGQTADGLVYYGLKNRS